MRDAIIALEERCDRVCAELQRIHELQRTRRENGRPSASVNPTPHPPSVATAEPLYPLHWLRASDRRDEAPKHSGGAGVDYPARWETSPVDLNDEASPRERRSSTAGSGAGVDYPANWKR